MCCCQRWTDFELHLQVPLFLHLLQHHWTPPFQPLTSCFTFVYLCFCCAFVYLCLFFVPHAWKKSGGRLQSGSCPRLRGHSLKRRLAPKISGAPRTKKWWQNNNGINLLWGVVCVLLWLCFTTTRFWFFNISKTPHSQFCQKSASIWKNVKKQATVLKNIFQIPPPSPKKTKFCKKFSNVFFFT